MRRPPDPIARHADAVQQAADVEEFYDRLLAEYPGALDTAKRSVEIALAVRNSSFWFAPKDPSGIPIVRWPAADAGDLENLAASLRRAGRLATKARKLEAKLIFCFRAHHRLMINAINSSHRQRQPPLRDIELAKFEASDTYEAWLSEILARTPRRSANPRKQKGSHQ